MGGGRGFHAGAGGSGHGGDVDFAGQQARCRERQERQLDGGGETPGIGYLFRRLDLVALPLRQSVDVSVLLIPEVLRQVDDLEPFRFGMGFPECLALPVGAAQEKDIDPAEIEFAAEMQVGISDQAAVDFPKGVPGVAFRVDEDQFHLRVEDQEAD